jgi:hypothetical protein
LPDVASDLPDHFHEQMRFRQPPPTARRLSGDLSMRSRARPNRIAVARGEHTVIERLNVRIQRNDPPVVGPAGGGAGAI